jgi:putative transposase
MYQWRAATEAERSEILASRYRNRWPAHSPPRWRQESLAWFHLTAACYEHAPYVGYDHGRMDAFADELIHTCRALQTNLAAWCVLPNHYHLLVEAAHLSSLCRMLGRLHGRSSRAWNRQELKPGRKVFHRTADRHVRTERHFYATLNYVHHNPVHHGYASTWTGWPWSSAHSYLNSVGREEAKRIWRAYPVLDYGKEWDQPEL